MIGSNEVSSSFVIERVRKRCCLRSGAQEKDNRRVEAKVWPPCICPWGKGGSGIPWGGCGGGCWSSGGRTVY